MCPSPRRTPAPALAPSRAAFPPPDAAAVLKQTPFLPSSQSAVFLTFLSCHRRRCHWCRGTGEGSAMPAGRVQGRADLRCGCSCLGQPKAPSTRAPSCRGCFRHLQIDWLTRPKGKSCLHSSWPLPLGPPSPSCRAGDSSRGCLSPAPHRSRLPGLGRGLPSGKERALECARPCCRSAFPARGTAVDPQPASPASGGRGRGPWRGSGWAPRGSAHTSAFL